MDWKKKILPIVGLILLVLTSATVMQYLFSKPSIDDQMNGFAKELNKQAPFMVDDQTRFDSAKLQPNQNFGFYYTLVNVDALNDSIDIKGFELVFRPVLEDFVRHNPDMKILRDGKASVSYAYYDKFKHFITTITITSKDIE